MIWTRSGLKSPLSINFIFFTSALVNLIKWTLIKTSVSGYLCTTSISTTTVFYFKSIHSFDSPSLEEGNTVFSNRMVYICGHSEHLTDWPKVRKNRKNSKNFKKNKNAYFGLGSSKNMFWTCFEQKKFFLPQGGPLYRKKSKKFKKTKNAQFSSGSRKNMFWTCLEQKKFFKFSKIH